MDPTPAFASTALLEKLTGRSSDETQAAESSRNRNGPVCGYDETPHLVTIGISHLRDGK